MSLEDARLPRLIAVVDDEEPVRQSMERWLRANGYEVALFADGAAFLDSLRERRPACVLTDGNMPGMNGGELLKRLARHAVHVPVIVVSGSDSPKRRQAAAALGVAGFFSKPFNPDALLRTIAAVVSVQEMSTEELERAQALLGYDDMTPQEREAFCAGLEELRGAQQRFHDFAVVKGGMPREQARIVWSKLIAYVADVIIRHERGGS